MWIPSEVAITAVVFGHADADGHLAAEQSRRNLEAEGINVQETVVSQETRGHRFWERGFSSYRFADIGLVVVVDIAFNFKDAASSLEAVLEVVDCSPSTHFVVVDHHPLVYPASERPNLTLREADSVFDCCYGTPSDELMVPAAICDGDAGAVRPRITETFEKRAVGVRRAAADRTGLAGSRLMALLRDSRWDVFDALASEPRHLHSSVRGWRRANCMPSPALNAARDSALGIPSK